MSENLQKTAEFTDNLVDFELTLKLQDKNLEIIIEVHGGEEKDANDLIHFLESFFRKYFPEVMYRANREIDQAME